MIDFVVRLAALVSFLTLLSGYSWGNAPLMMMEIAMLVLWIMQDFKHIKRLFNK